MIVGLQGKVEFKSPNILHVNVSGVIYEVSISLNTYAELSTDDIKIFTSYIVREDAQLLYGFSQMAEKIMFERLIKINGVGPKVAMAICSTFSTSSFANIINNNDVDGLKRVPGIGPKSAGRILVELSGFDTTLVQGTQNTSSATLEASLALETLGFKKDQIAKTLSSCTSQDTAMLVKEALKKLQKL